MSDKERNKSDLNDDSSSTTTTTVNSNRASIQKNNINNNSLDLNQNFNSEKLRKSNKMEPNLTRYEIKHLSGDHEDEDDFNDEYEPRGIIDYFDESELQPTTANMILDFDPHKVLELPESNIKKSILKIESKGDTSDENKENEKFKRTRISHSNSIKENQPSIIKNPLTSFRKESIKRQSLRSNLPPSTSINEIKRLQRMNSFKNQNFYKKEKSDEDITDPDDSEEDSNLNTSNRSDLDLKKKLPIAVESLTSKRLMKQKQKEIENAHQKQIKYLSKQQIQERQHLHQYPHPTQQQRHQQQQQLKLMFAPRNENSAVPSRSMSISTNLQTTSGYIIDPDDKVDLWGQILISLSYFFLIFSFPFSLCTCLKVAQEYERAVIFRLGRILKSGEKGPGIFFVLPCIDTYTKVDLRTVTFDVPPQEILTRDSVTVSVDAVVYFRIFNAVISVINVEDAAKSTKLLAASTLRNILGTKSLHEILSDRESVAILIQNNLDEATEPWGVKVERVEVKDVRLPVQLQRAMATEAEAAREARAKVIAAEGEQKASKALKDAADVISESSIAIQLRYLQTLTQIASEKNSTIVFPIPLEMISSVSNRTYVKR